MKIKAGGDEILVKLFGSTSRARILTFLFSHVGQFFYQREIMFESGLSLQAVQRELNNLVDLGVVKKEEIQNRVYYQADSASPFFRPLREICNLASEGKG